MARLLETNGSSPARGEARNFRTRGPALRSGSQILFFPCLVGIASPSCIRTCNAAGTNSASAAFIPRLNALSFRPLPLCRYSLRSRGITTLLPAERRSDFNTSALRSTASGKSSKVQPENFPAGRSDSPRRPMTAATVHPLKVGISWGSGSPEKVSSLNQQSENSTPVRFGPPSLRSGLGTIEPVIVKEVGPDARISTPAKMATPTKSAAGSWQSVFVALDWCRER